MPPPGSASPFHALDRRAVGGAMVAAIVSLACWLWASTTALADDGPQLVHELASPDGLPLWNHTLYFPAARLLGLLGARPDCALSLLSAIAGAVLVGTTCASAFVVTGSRRVAALTCLVVAATPAVAHHATFVEVHALHGATVGVVVLALLLLRRSPRLVLLAAFTGAALAVLTHRSAALLVPALVVVVAAELQPLGAVRPLGRAVLAVGAGAALGYACDEMLHRWLGGQLLSGCAEQIAAMPRVARSRMLGDEVLLPLCGLTLAALAAWGRPHREPGALRWAPLLAFVAFGVPIVAAGIETDGGYWLGAVPVLALGTAMQVRAMLARTPGRVAIALVIAVGAAWSFADVTAEARRDAAELRQRRIAAAARLLPAGGTLLSTGFGMQYVDGVLPALREVDLTAHVGGALLTGVPVDKTTAVIVDIVANEGARSPPALVWTSEWRRVPGLPPHATAYLARIEADVLQRFGGTPVASDLAPAWRLELRPR